MDRIERRSGMASLAAIEKERQLMFLFVGIDQYDVAKTHLLCGGQIRKRVDKKTFYGAL
jgi:hypothetical protein